MLGPVSYFYPQQIRNHQLYCLQASQIHLSMTNFKVSSSLVDWIDVPFEGMIVWSFDFIGKTHWFVRSVESVIRPLFDFINV